MGTPRKTGLDYFPPGNIWVLGAGPAHRGRQAATTVSRKALRLFSAAGHPAGS
jgi:hypothetical protein